MSEGIKRRPVVAALGAAIGIAVAGGIAFEFGLFGRRYAPTPYDDLLDKLPDRERAAMVGKAARTPDFDAAATANRLRPELTNRPLKDAVRADIDAGRLQEVKGWVMPQSLVDLSMLAAG